jgi:EAL domain-containing protein (putative c-di-GMP-specific phosphodiesterase class I)
MRAEDEARRPVDGSEATYDGRERVPLQQRSLALDLARVIADRRLSVRYQPIVDLANDTVLAVEALARWSHPHRGPIPPSVFIPLAEQTGLIGALDRWMLRTACRQVKAWHDRFPARPPLVANVNLSSQLLGEPTLIEDVRRVLDATGLDPRCLRLEITESVLLCDSPANVRALQALRQLGATIAIDDFGTGYASLDYLRWLPADVLKLDRSFVARLGQSPRDAIIVQGIIDLAQRLDMSLTAEGVETRRQRDHLHRLGCDWGQGYYFAPPLRAQELEVVLEAEQALGLASGAIDDGGAAPAPRVSAGDLRVLVVDDDDHIRQMTSCALELGGYDVVTAANGLAALGRLQRRPASVIVLDMMMPIMDGRGFSEAYRELPGPHAPIVVLTAASDPAACAAQVGAADYLAKPFDVDDLLASVGRLVSAGRC